MNDITEVDRLNAKIADLEKTIEWYQGRTGIMMGAAAGAALAAVPASEPVALTEHDLGIIRDIDAMAAAPNDNWWSKALALGASGLIKRLRAAAPAPVSGMPDLAKQIRALRTPNVLIANSESYIEGFAKARQMAADLATLPAAPAPTHANAGSSPGDMPMDRFIAALPLPQYPVAAPAPTDLSKRLREIASDKDADATSFLKHQLILAADEIERYYGGMLAWKRAAEAKDRASAETAAPGASAK